MSDGFTRRELFLMGNALAVPTLLGRLDAPAEATAAGVDSLNVVAAAAIACNLLAA